MSKINSCPRVVGSHVGAARQIVFSQATMPGVVAGRISQTRRVIWLQNEAKDPSLAQLWATGSGVPFYPGDRLWGTEPWAVVPERRAARADLIGPHGIGIVWQANCPPEETADYYWRPARQMPRWASRVMIEIEMVRVQRIQDISEADALTEGVMRASDGKKTLYYAPGHSTPFENPILAYRYFWDALHRHEAEWRSNHGVWVLSFSRVESGGHCGAA